MTRPASAVLHLSIVSTVTADNHTLLLVAVLSKRSLCFKRADKTPGEEI